jgi:hypothetical protein
LPLLVLAIAGLIRRRRDADVRQLLGFTALSLLGLAAIASVFMLGWQGYVPRRTGGSRIVLEASLIVPPFAAIGLQSLSRDISRRSRPRWLGTTRHRAAALAVAISVCALVSMIRVADYDSPQVPTRDELAVWESLPLTSSDLVLANGYTEGFIPDVTPAEGLLDGRAPYTFASLMDRANRLFRGAQAFFDDPTAHWDYLADNGVTWVVVGDADSHSLGTGNVWETPPNLSALEGCAGLEEVVRQPTITAFRVVDAGPDGCASAGG